MKQEMKARYLSALRSGKYKQTKGAMSRADGCYCALGLLLKLVESSVPYRLGVTAQQQCLLVSMNDEQGLTFGEIADYIESNW